MTNSRTKGQVGEREIVHFLKQWFPNAERGIQNRYGFDVADVENVPFWVEVKRRKKKQSKNMILKWWHKAFDDQQKWLSKVELSEEKPILLFTRWDRDKWYVYLHKEIYKKLNINMPKIVNKDKLETILILDTLTYPPEEIIFKIDIETLEESLNNLYG